MYSELLPLGSVVTIKDIEPDVIIIGRVASRSGEDKVYDYIGAPYPLGVIDPDQLVFFDHDQVDDIDFIGCKNELEVDFRERVLNKLDDLAPLTVKDGQIVSAK